MKIKIEENLRHEIKDLPKFLTKIIYRECFIEVSIPRGIKGMSKFEKFKEDLKNAQFAGRLLLVIIILVILIIVQ